MDPIFVHAKTSPAKSLGQEDMEFTGERVVPDVVEVMPLFEEHLARYFFASKFVQNQKVLDLGCGTGYGSYHLSQNGAQSVLAGDLDGETVRYAHHNYQASNLAFFQSDALHIPMRSQSFDMVVSFEVIEHLEPATGYLAEISRLLTDQGWLIGSTPNRLIYSMGAEKPHNPFHRREYDPPELETLLGNYFRTVVILGQRPYHGFVIGPVPRQINETDPPIEFLQDNFAPERSIADSKYLVYLATKSNTPVRSIESILQSHYYLGQPASYYDMLRIVQIQSLERHCTQLQQDYRKLETLVKGYESGRFMRLMTLLHRWRSKVLGSS